MPTSEEIDYRTPSEEIKHRFENIGKLRAEGFEWTEGIGDRTPINKIYEEEPNQILNNPIEGIVFNATCIPIKHWNLGGKPQVDKRCTIKLIDDSEDIIRLKFEQSSASAGFYRGIDIIKAIESGKLTNKMIHIKKSEIKRIPADIEEEEEYRWLTANPNDILLIDENSGKLMDWE
jgi:hypothetical protein